MSKISIIVAVETYSDSRIPTVKYAENDAHALSEALQQNGFDKSDQIVLLSVAATKTSIESRLRKVIRGLTEEDTLYVYFAGHGFAENSKNYITCYDTKLDDLRDTSIAVEWLFGLFKKSACRKIVLFLDSCESGMLATTKLRGIYTDLTEDELKKFFSEAEHCVCFAACKPGEHSHPADALKHGIWTHHLVEALVANVPGALEKKSFLTSTSLQNYLRLEVPRTIRKLKMGVIVQTPWAYGALSNEFLIADVSEILRKRKAAANPHTNQLARVALLSDKSLDVRRLSGFKKTHRVPDRVNNATQSFVEGIAEANIDEEIQRIFDSLRNNFGFKRKDISAGVNSGKGSIITPFFDYEVTVELDPDDPSNVNWRSQVVNIREPDKILTEAFSDAFKDTFDTLEFAGEADIDVTAIVDRIEALDDDSITIKYDSGVTRCTIEIEGLDGIIEITSDAFRIVLPGADSPKKLIESFFESQRKLIDTHNIRELPFTASTNTK